MTVDAKVLVAGSRFGAVYADAVAAADGFCLVGVLGRGSERTLALAKRHDVPAYTEPAQVPADVDVACVVVGTGFAGGAGTDLAKALLERGIPVLQEHPVPDSELAATLKLARARAVGYRVTTMHTEAPAVGRFVRAVHRLGRPVFVDAACAVQMSYTLVDVLARALRGTRPFRCAAAPVPASVVELAETPPTFRVVQGVVGGVPLTLRVQNQLHVGDHDPESHMFLPLRVTAGFEGGTLTLADMDGPVLWGSRPRIEADQVDLGVAPLGPASGPGIAVAGREVWPQSVRRAVGSFWRDVRAGVDPMREGQHHLAVARCWQELYQGLGYPELVDGPLPRALAPAEVAALTEQDHEQSSERNDEEDDR